MRGVVRVYTRHSQGRQRHGDRIRPGQERLRFADHQGAASNLYQAFLDPAALVAWLPPAGMRGHVYEFDARPGGAYRMSLTYMEPDHSPRGKTSDRTDMFRVRFLELIPDERIVQLIEFESKD